MIPCIKLNALFNPEIYGSPYVRPGQVIGQWSVDKLRYIIFIAFSDEYTKKDVLWLQLISNLPEVYEYI